MRTPLLSLLVLVLLLTTAAGCSTTDADLDPPPDTEATSLPLLAPGLTVGTTFYGSAELPEPGSPTRALLDTAVSRGLGGFTYYVDWIDLEPTPGRYTLDTFTATLEALQALGVVPFVNITVGDIGDYNLPRDLSDGAGGLADGVSLGDDATIERFGRILDRVAPLVVRHGGFFLGVGNEIDARLDEDFPDERGAYVRFVEAARERVHRTEPRLAVGVVLTNRAIRTRSATFRAFRAVSDLIPYNHAPIRPDFFVMALDEIQDDFRDVADAFGDGPIVIQELTCPSPSAMGASEAWQEGCFERLFEAIQATPQVRFTSVFTLQDFDEPTCELVREALYGEFLEEVSPDFAERFAEYLCHMGVIHPDGTPKPAWDAVLNASAEAASG